MPLPLGTILDGKFKIVQVLGEGGWEPSTKLNKSESPATFGR